MDVCGAPSTHACTRVYSVLYRGSANTHAQQLRAPTAVLEKCQVAFRGTVGRWVCVARLHRVVTAKIAVTGSTDSVAASSTTVAPNTHPTPVCVQRLRANRGITLWLLGSEFVEFDVVASELDSVNVGSSRNDTSQR